MPPKNNLSKLASQPGVRKSRPGVSYFFSLALPDKITDKYDAQAEIEGKTTDEVIVDRLTNCADHTSEMPLYATDDERRKLDELLGYNFRKMSDVIARIERLMACVQLAGEDPKTIKPVSIPLTLQQIERLKGLCHYGTPFNEKVVELVSKAINRETGLF